jgi:tetratricopeptide (TPR) repeat protein
MPIRLFSRAILWAGMLSFPALAQQSVPPPAPPASEVDRRGDAYFNFSMGHYYEELFEDSGRSEHANLAIDFYRKAYALDPQTAVIGERLAEMYYKAQRIRDAVLELQEIIKREPENLSARRLLARIYLRSIGERASNSANRDIVGRAIEQLSEIVRLDPSDADAVARMARLYRAQGEDDKAVEALRAFLARNPDQPVVLRQLAQAMIERGDSAGAFRLLEEAVVRMPQPDLFLLLGDAGMNTRDYPRAEAAYRRAVESGGDESQSRRKLARCLLAQHKDEAAAEQFQKLIQLDSEDAENYLRLAQIYRQLRKLDAAEENLLLARQRAPGNLEILYTEAMLYEDQGRFEDSIRVLSSAVTALKANPARLPDSRRTLSILYEQLGRLYRETENFAAAISTYQEMLKFGPEEEKRARQLIADAYRENRDIAGALAESEKALQAFPSDRGVRVNHALLLSDNGETDRAVTMLRELLRGDASDREIFIALAQAYQRANRFEDAEKNIRQAEQLARIPAENEGLWLLLGAVYESQKKYDRAEAEFKRVLDLNPKNAQALNYFGYMLADRGVRLDEAIALIERALVEEPHNGAYLDSLGWAYFKQNRFEEAEKYLRRALERSGQDPTIREHVGDLYQQTGRPELAAKEWERSLAEWRRSIPSQRDPERIAEVDRKLSSLKHRLAQKSPPEAKPQ